MTLILLGVVCWIITSCAQSKNLIKIVGVSMEPSYPVGTQMRIEEVKPTELTRGDLIYFKLELNSQYYVKRLIGLPGETIKLAPAGIYIDGVLLSEHYDVIPESYDTKTFILSEDTYFVLGDNRPNSLDSNNFGAILGSEIIGRAVPID